LYTGTLEAYQGIDLLLDAFEVAHAEHPDLRLLIVGGTDSQITKYRNLVTDKSLDCAVTFAGMVSPVDIPSFVDSSDMIASPRVSGTNTPLKIYGYLRSGRAIVATDLPTHTQVLNESVARLAAPNSSDFAKGILDLAGDRALRDRLAAAARVLADRDFSDRSYIERVTGFYRSVLERNRQTDAAGT